VACFCTLLAGCSSEQAEPPAPAIRPVRYVESYSLGGARVRTFSGAAKASTRTNLSFKVAGTLTQLTLRVGETLRQGQVFARLDSTDYELQVERAAAGLAQGRAQLVNA
jgi:multidrug efflux pump subunit AcrA (membrane-fusion protein)